VKRRELVLALCAAALIAAAGSGARVTAQQYPPGPIGGTNATPSPTPSPAPVNPNAGPFCDLAHCLRYSGEVDGAFVAGRVEERGDLRVAAIQGCCDANSRVDVYIESVRTFLGTVHAAEDGSYLGVFTLPASIGPGLHHIIANIEGCGELRGELQVLAADTGSDDAGGGTGGGGGGDPGGGGGSGPGGGGPGGGGGSGPGGGGGGSSGDGVPGGLGDGTTVLGTTVENTGGGILPRTGGDLLRLLLWAIVLVAFGALTVLATKRLRRRFVPAFAGGGPRGQRPIAALPPPEVPFVDTSRFVPYLSRGESERRTGTRSSSRAQGAAGSLWTRAPKSGPQS
jgi:hypothetical protein